MTPPRAARETLILSDAPPPTSPTCLPGVSHAGRPAASPRPVPVSAGASRKLAHTLYTKPREERAGEPGGVSPGRSAGERMGMSRSGVALFAWCVLLAAVLAGPELRPSADPGDDLTRNT